MNKIRLAGRILTAIFLVSTIGLAIKVVVNAIITDLGATATTGTGRIPPAVTVITIDPAIGIIIQTIIADLGVTPATAAGRVAIAVFLVCAVDLVITVIVDTIIAHFRIVTALADRCIGTLAISAIHLSVAVIIRRVVADLGSTGIDRRVVVITINATAVPALGSKAVTITVSTGRSRTKITGVII